MLKNSNCNGCFFRSEFQDMGASSDVCTLFSDLIKAIKAVECNKGNCPCFVNVRKISDYLRHSVEDKIDLISLEGVATDYICTAGSKGSKY